MSLLLCTVAAVGFDDRQELPAQPRDLVLDSGVRGRIKEWRDRF